MSKSKSTSRKLGRKNRGRLALIEEQAARIRSYERDHQALSKSNRALRDDLRSCIRIEAIQRHDYPRCGMVIEVTAIAPSGNRPQQRVVRHITEEALRLRRWPSELLANQRTEVMQELLLSLESWPVWQIDHKM